MMKLRHYAAIGALALACLGGPASFAQGMSVEQASRAVSSLEESLLFTIPKKQSLKYQDGLAAPVVVAPDGSVSQLSAQQLVIYNALLNARQVLKKAKQDEFRSAISPDDEAAMKKASAAVSVSLPPQGRVAKESGAWVVTLADGQKRLPNAQEQAALDERDAIVGKLTARLKDKFISRDPLRILPAAAGTPREGLAKKSMDTILVQDLVFNRAAVLNADLVTEDGKIQSTIAKGSRLFVVDGPIGDAAYCLPIDSQNPPGWFNSKNAWIPCYFDTNGDGTLDKQTSGGAPLNGVYMYAAGFSERGRVVTPAATSALPYAEGYRQYVGVRTSGATTNRAKEETIYSLGLAVSKDGKEWAPVNGSIVTKKVTGEVPAMLDFMGGKIELHLVEGKVRYKIVETLPEQGYGLRVKTVTTTTYVPIYVPN